MLSAKQAGVDGQRARSQKCEGYTFGRQEHGALRVSSGCENDPYLTQRQRLPAAQSIQAAAPTSKRECHRGSKSLRHLAVAEEALCRANRKETWDKGIAILPLTSNIQRVKRHQEDSILQIRGRFSLFRGGYK